MDGDIMVFGAHYGRSMNLCCDWPRGNIVSESDVLPQVSELEATTLAIAAATICVAVVMLLLRDK